MKTVNKHSVLEHPAIEAMLSVLEMMGGTGQGYAGHLSLFGANKKRERLWSSPACLIPKSVPNDFACLPPGGSATTAGCAAWEPSWGFGACAMYDNYTYAGAAWVMGRDGRRYMHLFVR